MIFFLCPTPAPSVRSLLSRRCLPLSVPGVPGGGSKGRGRASVARVDLNLNSSSPIRTEPVELTVLHAGAGGVSGQRCWVVLLSRVLWAHEAAL